MAIIPTPVFDVDHIKHKVVMSNEKGYTSVASVTGVVNASTQQVYSALTRHDAPPSLRSVRERTRYQLLKAHPDRGVKVYDAEYIADFKVGSINWQGNINFHIEQDQPQNKVTMRLARPGFLQKLEISFNMRPLSNGCTAVCVEQKLKPSMPTWDPVSKKIVRNINKGLIMDTLTDTIEHVERMKHLPPPAKENVPSRGLAGLRLPEFNCNIPANLNLGANLNFPTNFSLNLPRLLALGSRLSLPWADAAVQ